MTQLLRRASRERGPDVRVLCPAGATHASPVFSGLLIYRVCDLALSDAYPIVHAGNGLVCSAIIHPQFYPYHSKSFHRSPHGRSSNAYIVYLSSQNNRHVLHNSIWACGMICGCVLQDCISYSYYHTIMVHWYCQAYALHTGQMQVRRAIFHGGKLYYAQDNKNHLSKRKIQLKYSR